MPKTRLDSVSETKTVFVFVAWYEKSSGNRHEPPDRLRPLAARGFGGLKIVPVLVNWIPRIDPVTDSVEAGHQLSREAQIGVAGWVRTAELDPLGFRVLGIDGDANGGRSITLRID